MARELPSLNALRAFEAAARLESISRAGSELHVTHGAISRQIRALEAELGVALFQRQGRGVTLTAAGVRLRDAAALSFGQGATSASSFPATIRARPSCLDVPAACWRVG